MVDGRVFAHVSFGDVPRSDSAAAIAALSARGWEVELLTGDAIPTW